MISLCQKTLKLAEEKNNFSMWVRSQLLKEEQKDKLRRYRYTCLVCNYHFDRSSERVDPYFYCPNMMKDKCTNQEVLRGLET